MNMFKKNGGFTLVELIVVIAILAILAGVAVPAYSGYIASANEAADITALGAVKTAAMATFATEGSVTKITVTDAATDTIAVEVDNTAVTFTADNTADFQEYYNGAFAIELKTGSTAVWDETTGEWAISGTPYKPAA